MPLVCLKFTFLNNGTVFLFLPAFCQQWGNVNELPFLDLSVTHLLSCLANIPFFPVSSLMFFILLLFNLPLSRYELFCCFLDDNWFCQYTHAYQSAAPMSSSDFTRM